MIIVLLHIYIQLVSMKYYFSRKLTICKILLAYSISGAREIMAAFTSEDGIIFMKVSFVSGWPGLLLYISGLPWLLVCISAWLRLLLGVLTGISGLFLVVLPLSVIGGPENVTSRSITGFGASYPRDFKCSRTQFSSLCFFLMCTPREPVEAKPMSQK